MIALFQQALFSMQEDSSRFHSIQFALISPLQDAHLWQVDILV